MIPIRTVTWADFLLADILTSLAKPLSDAERAVSRMVTWDSQIQVLHESDAHDGASLLVPTFLAVPYLSRLFQCIKVYHETGNPSHIMNALKYFSALPVILLSSTKYHVPQEAWHQTYKPLWLLMALVNSAFSYYWDVERDWELPLFSQFRKFCCS